MRIGSGQIDETFMQDERAARILCDPTLVPAPGQYLLAHAPSETTRPLAVPVFRAGSHSRGFYAAAPLPVAWTAGTILTLRGPLGRGFHLPRTARRVALAALGNTPARLLALIEPAVNQNAEITLLSHTPPANLPPDIEILPLTALTETIRWADYLALDTPRTALSTFQRLLATNSSTQLNGYTIEILVETPLACAGMAECGVCAVTTSRVSLLACKDGPVFDWKSLFGA
ncbi:MAG: hypothetical protein N2117_05055 [Anaerolineales bacterium]|nr:hypothetical protein [Anaerolineales bacterium]MCX7754598.1 hypothetical protein [Anaerolineales bacterium]MDW8278121.1 hypothetical protein [Anaerolineales bacterium]